MIFFITETYLTTFVRNFFYFNNFWFDPAASLEVPNGPLGPPGVGDDPKVIFSSLKHIEQHLLLSNLC